VISTQRNVPTSSLTPVITEDTPTTFALYGFLLCSPSSVSWASIDATTYHHAAVSSAAAATGWKEAGRLARRQAGSLALWPPAMDCESDQCCSKIGCRWQLCAKPQKQSTSVIGELRVLHATWARYDTMWNI